MSELPVFLPANRAKIYTAVQTHLHKVTEKDRKCPGKPHLTPFSPGVLHNWRLLVENQQLPGCPIPTPLRAITTSIRAVTTRHRAETPQRPLAVFPVFGTFIPEIFQKNQPHILFFPTFPKFTLIRRNPLIDILRYPTAPGRCALPGAVCYDRGNQKNQGGALCPIPLIPSAPGS